MKLTLGLSLVANLVLLLLLCWSIVHRSAPGASKLVESGPEVQGNEGATDQAATTSFSPPRPELFHWSQLESTDYLAFALNLRAIGCPEQTIRDILEADVRSLYRRRRLEVRSRFPLEKNFSRQSLAQQRLGQALEELEREEAWVLNNMTHEILGGSGSRVLDAAGVEAATLSSMPLACQSARLDARETSPERELLLAELKEDFLREVGAAGNEPREKVRAGRWEAARRRADEQLKAFIGVQAFQELQVRAQGSL